MKERSSSSLSLSHTLMAVLLSLSPHPPNRNLPVPKSPPLCTKSRRHVVLKTTSLFLISAATPQLAIEPSVSEEEASSPAKPPPLGIVNTKSWFQFYGDGFSMRVPPQFEDIMEPEDFDAGLSLYGDKVMPKTYPARFASSDGSEVLSVIIRPTNQLKIAFLEAQDVTDWVLERSCRNLCSGWSDFILCTNTQNKGR